MSERTLPGWLHGLHPAKGRLFAATGIAENVLSLCHCRELAIGKGIGTGSASDEEPENQLFALLIRRPTGSHPTSDKEGTVKFRGEGGNTNGFPHVVAEAFEALRSECRLRVHAHFALTLGAQVRLMIEDEDGGEPVLVAATVIRVDESGAACKFEWIKDGGGARLSDIVARLPRIDSRDAKNHSSIFDAASRFTSRVSSAFHRSKQD